MRLNALEFTPRPSVRPKDRVLDNVDGPISATGELRAWSSNTSSTQSAADLHPSTQPTGLSMLHTTSGLYRSDNSTNNASWPSLVTAISHRLPPLPSSSRSKAVNQTVTPLPSGPPARGIVEPVLRSRPTRYGNTIVSKNTNRCNVTAFSNDGPRHFSIIRSPLLSLQPATVVDSQLSDIVSTEHLNSSFWAFRLECESESYCEDESQIPNDRRLFKVSINVLIQAGPPRRLAASRDHADIVTRGIWPNETSTLGVHSPFNISETAANQTYDSSGNDTMTDRYYDVSIHGRWTCSAISLSAVRLIEASKHFSRKAPPPLAPQFFRPASSLLSPAQSYWCSFF